MRTAWEKTALHLVETMHGHDISNELHNKKKVIIAKPELAEDVFDKHAERVSQHENQEPRPERARLDQKKASDGAVAGGEDAAAPMLLAILENEIEEATCQAAVCPSIKSNETEKTEA
jgi:hypothetical protein